jgi:hypothetical protein
MRTPTATAITSHPTEGQPCGGFNSTIRNEYPPPVGFDRKKSQTDAPTPAMGLFHTLANG